MKLSPSATSPEQLTLRCGPSDRAGRRLVIAEHGGKSFLACDMASRVSTGTAWPDGTPCPHGSVILMSAEDDPGDTVRPRLDAHRADAQENTLLNWRHTQRCLLKFSALSEN